MKPIKLVMSAFGSYTGEETIDFSGLKGGIFLITGDTGAGKTTIFDGITYALYGVTSGNRRTGKMMGSQGALSGKKTWVEYTFEEKGERYTICRRPDIPGQTGKVELILPDGKVFPGKLRETNHRIEELVGLDVNQFCQVAMIAQGDFRELLLASSNDRKQIFEKIFATNSYRQVQILLNDACKKCFGVRADLEKYSEREMELVQVPPESPLLDAWNLQKEQGIPQIDHSGLFELLDQILLENRRQEEETKEQKKKLEEDLLQIRETIHSQEEIQGLYARLEQEKKQMLTLQSQKMFYEEQTRRIEAARRALLVDEKARQVSLCNGRYLAIKKELSDLKEEEERLEDARKEGETRFLERERLCREQLPQLQKEASLLEQGREEYQALQQLLHTQEEKKTQYAKLHQDWQRQQERLEQNRKQRECLQKEQEELADCQEIYYQSCEQLRRMVDKEEILEQIGGKRSALETLLNRKKANQRKLERLLQEHGRALSGYQQAYEQFIAEQAGLMAQNLRDGIPCPVCGSTSHPHKARLSLEAVTQEETEQKKRTVQQLEQQIEQARAGCMQLDGQLEGEKKEILGLFSRLELLESQEEDQEGGRRKERKGDPLEGREEEYLLRISTGDIFSGTFWEQMEEQRKIWKQRVDGMQQQNVQARKRIARYEEVLRLQKQLREHLQKEELEEKQRKLELDAIRLELVRLEAEVQNGRNRLPCPTWEEAGKRLQNLKNQMEAMARNQEQAQQELLEIRQKQTRLQGRRQALKQQGENLKQQVEESYQAFCESLEEQDFADKEAYLKSRMEPQERQKQERACETYQKDCIRCESALQTYQNQLQGRTARDLSPLKEREGQLLDEKGRLEEQQKTIFSIRENNGRRRKALKSLLKEYEAVKKQYQVLNHLNRTANGKLELKMDFQTYMLRRFFEEIIYEANKRLRVMTRDQFILQCRSYEHFSGNAAAGLDLDVYSLTTGQTRDVKTLSGGESFMAALSMALGMADIIQSRAGSIHLDTMFIDEGFGSLDEQSREEAIQVLSHLAGEKRLVGIISHVTELKEQIGQKLVITRDEQGSHARWD